MLLQFFWFARLLGMEPNDVAFSVDVEGSMVALADLGFDEHDRDGTPSISEGLPPLRTWELEPEPEQGSEFETDFEPEPEPEPWPESES